MYQHYKKGKEKMDKVKNFVVEHKNEIILASVALFSYKIGFKRGFDSAQNAITHLCNEAAKVMEGR